MATAMRNKGTNAPRKSPAVQDPSTQPPAQQPPAARRANAWRNNSNPPPSVYAPPPSSRLTHQPQTTQQQPPPQATQTSPSQPQPQSQSPGSSQTLSQPLQPSATVHTHVSAPDTPLPTPSHIGNSITVSTRSGQRYQGTLIAVPAAADADASIQLRDVRDLSNPTATNKENVTLPAGSLAHWEPAHKTNGVNGTTPLVEFKIDADISALGAAQAQARRAASGERELQAWQPEITAVPLLPANALPGVRGDEATFGPGANGAAGWDQFATNERMFGVKTSFNEELYTTKLDRSHPDFKERERKAQMIANEIMGSMANNPHIAEERNMNLGGGAGATVDDSGVNEEDKYAGVVRGPNAYVPPARRQQLQQQQQSIGVQPSGDVPKVSVTEASTTSNSTGAVTAVVTTANTPAATSPAQTSSPNNDLVPTFREFVTNEKVRLTQKKQAIVRSEMDKRMSELVKFSQSFKLNKPIPDDLVAILAKDEGKQRQIREKSEKDAVSAAARQIGNNTPAVRPAGKNVVVPATPGSSNVAAGGAATGGKVSAATTGTTTSGAAGSTSSVNKAASGTAVAVAVAAAAGPKKIPMVIQKIPAFNPNKAKSKNAEKKDGASADEEKKEREKKEKENDKKAEEVTKLNVNAPTFNFKPGTSSFKGGHGGTGTGTNSSKSGAGEAKTKAVEPTGPPNPFFGTRSLKKATPVHVKDDFNPFKTNGGKMPDPTTILANWPYQGKRFMHTFPPVQSNPAPVPVPTPPVNPVQSMQPPSMGVQVPMQPGMSVGLAPPSYVEEDQSQSGSSQVSSGAQPQQQNQQQQNTQQQQQPGPHHHLQRTQSQMPSATAAAAVGTAPYGATMVYYPAYAYPGQPPHMMAAATPPGGMPPAGYMHSPFITPMHYPPGAMGHHPGVPNGHGGHAMYAPPHMAGMPPQQYMQPPPGYGAPPPGPPGPPPPGSNGGRGSMPPTPMPPHAHAYYHPSPQLSHAVPYQMMMPPPPNSGAPPPPHTHSYDPNATATAAPPPSVPMGGHA